MSSAGFGYEAPTEGASVEWYTPPEIFVALGLEFDVDVAAPANGIPWIPAKRYIAPPWDGLVELWDGLVWIIQNEFGKIDPCRCDCHRLLPKSAMAAGAICREIQIISIPAPSDRSAFLPVVKDVVESKIVYGDDQVEQSHREMQAEFSDVPVANRSGRRGLSISHPSGHQPTVSAPGVENVSERMPGKDKPNGELIESNEGESSQRSGSTDDPLQGETVNAGPVQSTIIAADRESSPCHGSGLSDFGNNALKPGVTPAPIAEQKVPLLPKTTSSHYQTGIAPEPCQRTSYPPAVDVTTQKDNIAARNGVVQINVSLPSIVTSPVCKQCKTCLIGKYPGLVWCNPPYGQETGKWVKRLAGHGYGVALVFARTDTRWWQEDAVRADVICFVRGRIRFRRAAGVTGRDPTAASALLAFGSHCACALELSGLGCCVHPVKR